MVTSLWPHVWPTLYVFCSSPIHLYTVSADGRRLAALPADVRANTCDDDVASRGSKLLEPGEMAATCAV